MPISHKKLNKLAHDIIADFGFFIALVEEKEIELPERYWESLAVIKKTLDKLCKDITIVKREF